MSKVSYGLEGKVAVVTGGSRGIGLEIARALMAEKARVAICGRKQEGLDAAVSDLGKSPDLLAVSAHIAREDDVKALFGRVAETFGRVDILINNVGMNIITGLCDAEVSLWNKIIESNLTGAFLCAREAARLMREGKKGKIVSITSLAARRSAPAMGIYGVAKAGIEMMTRVLAQELASFGVQVNAVAPGMVKTGFSAPFWSNPEIHDQIVKTIPSGRVAEPADIVGPVLFLCSGASDFITGQTLPVDGGASAI
jgi:NAD(P)-dependent dehydrogenase (short-subunit alcohol dehydrogenase family)